MTSYKYTYSINDDFPNQKVNAGKLAVEIYDNDIITAVDFIETGESDCNIWFKAELNSYDSTHLDYIISIHDGEPLPEEDINPRMDDGRLIVRADSRPLDCQTYFTMVGDDSTAGIGYGVDCMWDFSNNNDIVTGDHVPPGMKCKEFILKFLCPVYTKDGCIYFSNMPWGAYITFDVVIPPNTYYPNPAGTIPAAALGLSGTDMYAHSGSEYISYAVFIMKHRIFGDCSMGDELNSEGSSTNPIPVGWGLRCRVYTLESDNVGKGFGEFELHRRRTVLLPGESIN